MKEPKVSVGVMFEPKIEFVLNSGFICNGAEYSGVQSVKLNGGKIEWLG